MFKFQLLPREMRFFDLFEAASVNLVEAGNRLADLMNSYERVEEKVRAITENEHRGDSYTHQIMEQLHKTFITPLEREDIVALTHSLDDVMDFIEGAADTMLLYKIGQPTDTARKLGLIIVQMTEEIQKTMPLLRSKDAMPRILPVTVELNRLENEADDVMRSGIADLFENPSDVFDVIKWREIYELLETATDRGEDVANVLEGIVLKHT